MTRQDYIISAVLHITLFALIVILSSARSSANQFNPDDIAIVQVFDGIPKGAGSQPAEPVIEEPAELRLPDIPDAYAEDHYVEEEPIKLASIETPAKIAVKEVKARQEPKPKPKEKSKPKTEEKKPSGAQTKTKIGEGEVTTSIGVGDEPGGQGVMDFPYNIGRAAQMIRNNWDNPIMSQGGYSCVIYFQIDRQGFIRGVAVETPSKSPQYDLYARMAVEKTRQLPPLPPSYKYDFLGFHLEFEYIP